VREVAAAGVVETLASVLQGAWSAPVHRLVLLGLGSPTSSATSRYQLALGLLLGPAVGLAGVHALRRTSLGQVKHKQIMRVLTEFVSLILRRRTVAV
jgi:hypothetical protein